MMTAPSFFCAGSVEYGAECLEKWGRRQVLTCVAGGAGSAHPAAVVEGQLCSESEASHSQPET